MVEARHATIQIDYPGSSISCNHYLGRRKGGGYYMKQEAKDFQYELGWMIKHLHIEEWNLPLEITCSGVFKDLRSAPDLSNLSKVINDGVQEVTGHNDKDFRWHDGSRTINEKVKPYLLITIRESPINIPCNALELKSARVNVKSNKSLPTRRKYTRKTKGE